MHLTSNPTPMLQNSAQQPPLRGEAGGGSVFDKFKEKAWAAIKRKAENGEDGPNYLAVLIANKLTAKPQVGVDYGGQNMVKFVQDEKYSTKSCDFLRFFTYLCHVIDDFACLDLQH